MPITKIFGGPGCGKSTELIKIIKGSALPLREVCYITFSKRAMEDMKKRMTLEGADPDYDLDNFRTIHGLCFKLLGVRKNNIADNRLREFCKKKGFKMSERFLENITKVSQDSETLAVSFIPEETLDEKFYLQMCQDRQDRRPKGFVHPRLLNYGAEYLEFVKSYKEWMQEEDLVDFIGLLEEVIDRGITLDTNIKLFCVDEWQDLNTLQIELVTMWSTSVENVFYGGDDDQCIHEWAGARPGAFMGAFCDNETILSKSYRLPSDVLDLANTLISKNTKRISKNLYTDNPKTGEGIVLDSIYGICQRILTNAKNGDKGTVYVLVRNNYIKGMVLKDLRENGVPVGGLISEKESMKIMLSRKKLFTPKDLRTMATGSIFPSTRYFKRGAKKRLLDVVKFQAPEGGYTWKNLRDYGLKEEFFSDLYRGEVAYLNIPPENIKYIRKVVDVYGWEWAEVSVMTIHQSKGLEADTVVVVCDVSRKTLDIKSIEELESERRVWYTAITRARKRLYIASGTEYSPYKTQFENFVKVFLAKNR